jgi:hypothetical protein
MLGEVSYAMPAKHVNPANPAFSRKFGTRKSRQSSHDRAATAERIAVMIVGSRLS